MDNFTNKAQFTPPSVSNVLFRQRLFKQITESTGKKITFITGQPAQGKSVLVASYLAAHPAPFAWVYFSRQDSDSYDSFQLIVRSIIYSLQKFNQPANFSSLSFLLQTKIATKKDVLFKKWTQIIYQLISGDKIYIVLDSLDRLPPESSSLEFVKYLLNNQTSNVHFILISRQTSFLHDYKIKQKVYMIDNEDLALTIDETEAFFLNIREIELNKKQLQKIHKLTEGWFGGTILLSESLARMSEVSLDKYLNNMFPAQFSNDFIPYFENEIFNSQPANVQDFLIKSSIFDIMEIGLLKEFIEEENITEILQIYTKHNLFIESFFDEKNNKWSFRYHQLFRQFLLVKLSTLVSPKEIRSLYLKAAYLFEKNNRMENAIKYFFKANECQKAVQIIEKTGINLLKDGRTKYLKQMLQPLPDDIVQNSPWLLFYRSIIDRTKMVEENVATFERIFSLFEKRGDLKGQLFSMAFLLEASTSRGHDSIPLAKLLDKSTMLLEKTKDSQFLFGRAMLLYEMGFCQVLRGDPRKGAYACYKAFLIALQLKAIPLQIVSLGYANLGFSLLGEFRFAEEMWEKCSEILARYPNITTDLDPLIYTTSSMSFIYQGKLQLARELISLGLKEAEEQGLTYLYLVALQCDLMLRKYVGEYREGEEIGNLLLELIQILNHTYMHGSTSLQIGLLQYHNKNYQEAQHHIDTAIDILSSDNARAESYLNIARIGEALVSYHLDPHNYDLGKLEKTLAYFNDINSVIFKTEAHFVLGLLKWKLKEKAEAAKHLEIALKHTAEKENNHFILLNSSDIATGCILSFKLKLEEVCSCTTRILTSLPVSITIPKIEQLYQHADSTAKQKACAILKTIHRETTPDIYITTLGEFSIRLDDIYLDDSEWDRTQPIKLLKAIIARGGNNIPKDILIEDIWPESGHNMDNYFSVTLHRLRKTLEPNISKRFSSSYINLKGNLISLNHEKCRIDFEDFILFYKKAKEWYADNETDEALKFYKKAIDLYQGDFMPEEPYLSYIEPQRLYLKKIALTSINKIANIYDKQDNLADLIDIYEKGISIDPYQESLYRKLMFLYCSQGKRPKALEIFDKCKNALHLGLDIEPEKQTLELHASILANDLKGILVDY